MIKEWRRFIPLCDTKAIEELVKRKKLSRYDLALIFKSLDINHKIYPEIVKSREAAPKKLYYHK